MKNALRVFVPVFLMFTMVLWTVAPGLGAWVSTVHAEEITPTETPAVEPVVTETPAVTPVVEQATAPTETVTAPAETTPAETTVTQDPQPVISAWVNDGNKYTTTNTVELGTTYTAPQNDQVAVTFTKLPENSGKLSIEEITLTSEQVASLGALSNKAYDITSDMADGTFAFDLNLPKPANQDNVQIKFAEDVAGLKNADTVATSDVTTQTDSVSASLDHFTIFVVTGGAPTVTTTTLVNNLQPNWDSGVYSDYYWPNSGSTGGVSPGSTDVYDGRQAGIIKAGITPIVTDGNYEDEGILAFKVPSVGISTFASQALTYDVENQTGINPVWVRIRLVSGTQYQFVPASYGVGGGYHTINAAAGQWQLMNGGNATGPMMTLSQVATANLGAQVDRVYLTLGMGNSYNVSLGVGTVGWVDKATIGGTTYDFVVGAGSTPTSCTGASITPQDGTTACYSTIKAAIAAASSGDTINIAPGTYTEDGQIVISKNLSIIGTASTTTIIKPAQDTGNTGSGDSRGWFLVNSGKTFNLSNVTLDGAGKLVAIGILSRGNGTIENNIIKNIGYNPSTDYYGRGIQLYDTNMTVRNNTLQNIGRIGIFGYGLGVTSAVIEGNNYTGKGTGDWLDYGIELGAGAVATISNNIITDNTGVASSDGSTSAGILVTTYFAGGTTATITGNTITGNTDGIAVGYDSADTAVVTAHNNKIYNNSDTGISTKSSTVTVNATENWWGDASGPLATTTPVLNPTGTGSAAVGKVTYAPWYTDAGMTTLVAPDLVLTVPTPINITKTSLVSIAGGQSAINTAVGTAIIGLTPIQVTLKNVGGIASTNVRISPINAGPHIQLWAKDTSNNWYDINVTGWMDSAGNSIPAGYSATTDVYAISDTTGDYPLTVQLVNAVGGATVTSASGTVTVNVPASIPAERLPMLGTLTGVTLTPTLGKVTILNGLPASITSSNSTLFAALEAQHPGSGSDVNSRYVGFMINPPVVAGYSWKSDSLRETTPSNVFDFGSENRGAIGTHDNGTELWETVAVKSGEVYNRTLRTPKNYEITWILQKAGSPDIAVTEAFTVEQTLDTTAPTLTVTDFTADNVDMTIQDGGYVLNTNNDPTKEYAVQFKSGTVASEALASDYFGLKLKNTSTVSAADLKAYYAKNTSGDFLTYLDGAADGTNPLAYIKGDGTTAIQLIDGARHQSFAGSQDLSMAIPGDAPLGTYVLEGKIKDVAGNETTVTYRLIVIGDREAPTVISSANNSATKTVTYTFSEPIQFVNQANSSITQDPAGLVEIYTAKSYADRQKNDPEPDHFGGTNTATLNGNVLTILYTDALPADTYLADTWGYTVTDLAGNQLAESTTALFTVADTTAPVVASHDNLTVEATSASGAVVTYVSPATSDNVDAVGTANCSPTSGSIFALGVHTVTCNATDAAGNSATPAPFTVTVQDTIAPTIDSVSDIIAEATSASGATITITPPTSHDAVDGNLPASCDASTGVFALGDHTVTCSKTDVAGHTATPVTYHVTVHDTTAPVILTHDDITFESAAGTSMTVTYTAPNATDNVDPTAAATCTPASGTTFAMGNTTVTCSKTDATGHVATATTFIVHVVDTTAPATPTISTPVQTVNTDTINIAGTAETNSTVAVTGGASTATGTATGGFYNIVVTLTHNAVNNLNVTAKDASNNASSPVTVAITHDNTSVAPASLTIGSPTLTTLALSWTNNELNGSHYTIKRSLNPITDDTTFNAATTLGSAPAVAPSVPSAQLYTATNLLSGTTYYFAMRMTDAVGNVSPISNSASGTTSSAETPPASDTTKPDAVTLSFGSETAGQITLSWNATGDDGSTGLANKYIIKRSASEITDSNWSSAATIFNSLAPKSPGQAESFIATGLSANTSYCFAVQVWDEVPNKSTISNSSCASTLDNAPRVDSLTTSSSDNNVTHGTTIAGANFISGSNNTVRFSDGSNVFDLIGTGAENTTSMTLTIPVGVSRGTYGIKIINSNGTSVIKDSAYTVTVPATPPPSVSDLSPSTISTTDSGISITITGVNFTGATTVTIDGVTLTSPTITDTQIKGTLSGIAVEGTYDVLVATPHGTNGMSSVKLNVKAPVVIDSNTLEQTTEKPIDLPSDGKIPVQITMQSDETVVNTDTVGKIEVVLPPATDVKGSDGQPYEGNINPPQFVKPTEAITAQAGADAVVITMGNPTEKITFSNTFVVTVTLVSSQPSAPLIWYYNPAPGAGLEIAGVDGTAEERTKDGVTYAKGGTVLNTVDNGDGTYTYTIGLLLDHMSSYVAGVTPTISSLSTSSGVAESSVTITGTNFSPDAVVKFGDTTATVTARNEVIGITATVPSISTGSYSITVTNTDNLGATSPTIFKIVAASRGVSSGGPSCAAGTAYNPSTSSCVRIGATPATPAVPGVSPAVPATSATPATPAAPAASANGQGQGQVLGAATYNFTKDLAVGSRGTDVTALQQYLIDTGYSMPSGATGYFGMETKAAVTAFQKDRGIPQVGAVGPLTRTELGNSTATSSGTSSEGGKVLSALLYNFTKDLAVGSRGDDVTALQQYLASAGFYNGPVTGYFGQLTRTGVVAFQKAHNITPAPGNVGPKTRAELNKNTVVTSATTPTAGKTNLTAEQVNSIIAVIESFGADSATIERVKFSLGL